jgi:hypothetical protein
MRDAYVRGETPDSEYISGQHNRARDHVHCKLRVVTQIIIPRFQNAEVYVWLGLGVGNS